MDWQNKVVLITGAASGMGLAFARRFAAAGASLALADVQGERAAAAARALGPTALAITADVARVADCAAMVAAAVARFGRLDLLINSAGVWVEGPAEEMGEAEWDRCLDINLKGTFFACRYAIPELRKTQGAIVNIASDAGLMGSAGASIYCASKGGVVQLTRALALELAPDGVRCNAICPCDVDTPMLAGQAAVYGAGDPEGYTPQAPRHLSPGRAHPLRPPGRGRRIRLRHRRAGAHHRRLPAHRFRDDGGAVSFLPSPAL